MQKTIDTMLRPLAKWYKKSVYKSLAQYGLKYEDVIIAENPDVQRALKYLSPEELEARNRRLKRACDLSMKGIDLPEEIQKLQKPGEFYLSDLMEELRDLRKEREQLKSGKYQF